MPRFRPVGPTDVAPLDLVPLGDLAWLARFATEPAARRWAASAGRLGLPGVIDVVLAYRSVSVHFDPDLVDGEGLESALRAVVTDEAVDAGGRLVTLPVLYDGEDLAGVAGLVGTSIEGVVALHSGTVYDVFAIGFQPGFPYSGYLPSPLDRVPRRAEPRLRVPAGSVAIAAGQTGVYPAELPGGWHLLGRTPLAIVDVAAGRFPIRAGDRLAFLAHRCRRVRPEARGALEMSRSIDLNADLGEGMPWDFELLARVTSASVSCGAHAGRAGRDRRHAPRGREAGRRRRGPSLVARPRGIRPGRACRDGRRGREPGRGAGGRPAIARGAARRGRPLRQAARGPLQSGDAR